MQSFFAADIESERHFGLVYFLWFSVGTSFFRKGIDAMLFVTGSISERREFVLLEALGSLSFGYLLGNFNPAAVIAALKKTNLREQGTKNLGATNVTLAFGFRRGLLVMLVDILKGFLSVKVAKMLFPRLVAAGALAGCGSVLGHVYPVFLRFRGGKGLAAFGGMILALDPLLFLILLMLGIGVILVTDYPVILTFFVAVAAPWLILWRFGNGWMFCAVLLASGLLLFKHRENIMNLKNGTEGRLSAYIQKRKNSPEN